MAVSFSPDNQFLASGSEDKTIKLFEMSTNNVIHTFVGHSSVICSLDYSCDGRFIVSGSGDKTIRIWNVNHKKVF
jgi:general transcriptional corepressor TUP1